MPDDERQGGLFHTITQLRSDSLSFYSLIFFWYGFFIDFKPSEPFLVPYLINTKGFTNAQVEHDIFPIWTYAYFIAVVICGLLSEVFQYKPILILGSFARLATRLILIFGTSLLLMQATQLTFGLACGTEVLFYSYIYYLVPNEHYQKLTGITRSSVLIGHVGANLLGQLLVSRFNTQLVVLFYISLVSISIATIISFFFPHVTIELKSCKQNYQGLKSAFLDIVQNKETLQWAIWYMLAMACNDMVLNYATNLFYAVDSEVNQNGLVLALVRLSGALGAVLPSLGWVGRNIEQKRKLVVVILTAVGGLSIIATSFMDIWFVFVLLIVYMGVISFGISVAATQIAKSMSTRKFGAVFAVITIIYLAFETLFQFIIGVLSLSSKTMFLTFGCTLVASACVFACLVLAFRLRTAQPYVPLDTAKANVSIN